jgi:hypothetical protein
MSQFHAGVTRSGAGWLVRVAELNETIVARHRAEIMSKALDLILSKPGMADAEIDLLVQHRPQQRHGLNRIAVHRAARARRRGPLRLG